MSTQALSSAWVSLLVLVSSPGDTPNPFKETQPGLTHKVSSPQAVEDRAHLPSSVTWRSPTFHRVPLGLGVTEGERGEAYHVIVSMDDGERKGGSDKGLANIFSTRPARK